MFYKKIAYLQECCHLFLYFYELACNYAIPGKFYQFWFGLLYLRNVEIVQSRDLMLFISGRSFLGIHTLEFPSNRFPKSHIHSPHNTLRINAKLYENII